MSKASEEIRFAAWSAGCEHGRKNARLGMWHPRWVAFTNADYDKGYREGMEAERARIWDSQGLDGDTRSAIVAHEVRKWAERDEAMRARDPGWNWAEVGAEGGGA